MAVCFLDICLQGWREGPISFNPTYKYHLGCNVYSGEPVPPGIAAVKAVDSSASLADSAESDGRLDSSQGVADDALWSFLLRLLACIS